MNGSVKRKDGNLGSMLSVDFRRMFTQKLFYIMAGISFMIPILVLVMTTSFGAPQDETQAADMSFTNVWQIIGSLSSSSSMTMDMTSMCNINLLYFAAAVLVCVFVSDDFKSGYAKNIFTARTKKTDYVASKTIVCFFSCALMLTVFFIGAVIGGKIAGLSFDAGAANAVNIVMCMLSKIFLMGLFVSIYLLAAVAAKQKTWLGIIIGFAAGMLMFMMIPMMTPLDAGMMNVVMCLAGSAVFSAALAAAGSVILNKRDILR